MSYFNRYIVVPILAAGVLALYGCYDSARSPPGADAGHAPVPSGQFEPIGDGITEAIEEDNRRSAEFSRNGEITDELEDGEVDVMRGADAAIQSGRTDAGSRLPDVNLTLDAGL